MARLLGRTLLTLVLAGGALTVTSGPAQGDTGCVVWPLSNAGVPVYSAPTTSSPQVGTLTRQSGCSGPRGGAAYDLCGGGSVWMYIRNPLGYVPESCVDWAW